MKFKRLNTSINVGYVNVFKAQKIFLTVRSVMKTA